MPFLSPSALRDRLPERDADVLDRVVRVDVQVALRAHGEVDHAVARDLVEHVVEERHAASRGRRARCRRGRRSTVICVSRVLRVDACAARAGRGDEDLACVHGRAPSARKQRVVFVGRADSDPQAVRERRMRAVQILHQYAVAAQIVERQRAASAKRASTKLACVGETLTPRQRAKRRGDAITLGTDRRRLLGEQRLLARAAAAPPPASAR